MKGTKEQILEHWELINRLAVRRFGERPLAEEAALSVMNGLLENDGERLKKYSSKSSFAAYLASVTYHLLEDFARKRYGRKRAPLWIRNLGGIWLHLYTLLCLERLEPVEAIEFALQKGDEHPVETDVEDAAWIVKQQVTDCGSHQGLEVGYDEEQIPVVDEGRCIHQADRIEDLDKKQLFTMLFSILTDKVDDVDKSSLQKLCAFDARLSSEEKLLLKLCYQDELTVAAAGEMLGLNRHQAHGRLRRLLGRVREDLERIGLDHEILELLR